MKTQFAPSRLLIAPIANLRVLPLVAFLAAGLLAAQAQAQHGRFHHRHHGHHGHHGHSMHHGHHGHSMHHGHHGHHGHSMHHGSHSSTHVHNASGIHVQRPGLAILGGVLNGVAAGLNHDNPRKHGTAVGILSGIGNGAMISSNPTIWNQHSVHHQHGGFTHFGP